MMRGSSGWCGKGGERRISDLRKMVGEGEDEDEESSCHVSLLATMGSGTLKTRNRTELKQNRESTGLGK